MLTPAKVTSLLSGQSSLARKVYEATPIQDEWTLSQIKEELQSAGASSAEHRVLCGCLKDLRESGLVTESAAGRFRRVPVRLVMRKVEAPTTNQDEPAMQPASKPTSAIEVLADLSGEVIAFGKEVQGRMKQLAERIEEVALSVEQERESNAESLGKLQQLQTLLRSI